MQDAARRSLGRRAAFALVPLVCLSGLACRDRSRVVRAGFEFEPVTFAAPALGGPLDAADLAAIDAAARAELASAFDGMPIAFTGGGEVRYRVTVTEHVRDPRMRADMSVAGASRAVAGLGGTGVVNFSLLANAAISCAPAGSTRAQKIDAIGRGVGRAAAHEFAHQFLPRAPIHDSRDVRSYEYGAASRCEQYTGLMHWDLAGPLLRARFGFGAAEPAAGGAGGRGPGRAEPSASTALGR
jgi:hypothetical protein